VNGPAGGVGTYKHLPSSSRRRLLNHPVREEVSLTIQFEITFPAVQFKDSKLRFPRSVSIPFSGMAVFWSAEVVDS